MLQKSSKQLRFSSCSIKLQINIFRNFETNRCKIYIVIRRIDLTTITKLQTFLFNNINKMFSFSRLDNNYVRRENYSIALF